MALTPFQVFVAVPTSVDSQATQDTVIFDQQTVVSLTAKLAADQSLTPFTASSAAPAQLLPQMRMNYFNVVSPSDGQAFYVGTSAALTPATGALIGQGSRLKVTGYIGPVWVLGAAGASVQLFYQTG